MTLRERRAFVLASVLLLAAASLRALHERGRAPPVLPADSAGVLGRLTEESRTARADAERRKRPLAPGERLDPNRAPEAELDRLPGVGPSVARAMIAARDSGTVFRRPEDLARVRGIGPATVEKLRGHLELGDPRPVIRRRSRSSAPAGGFRPVTAPPAPVVGADSVVDLDRATATELERLPGIGPTLSGRILEARRRKGGFGSVDELLEVRGIGPATLERIRPRLSLPP